MMEYGKSTMRIQYLHNTEGERSTPFIPSSTDSTETCVSRLVNVSLCETLMVNRGTGESSWNYHLYRRLFSVIGK